MTTLKHGVLAAAGVVTYLVFPRTIHSETKCVTPVPQLQDLHIRPGLYIWGSNKYGVINAKDPSEIVKLPTRIPFFDGRLLRDLALGKEIAVAVLENGDIAQWGSTSPEPVILVKGLNVKKVGISDEKCVYALTKKGSLVSWPAKHRSTIEPCNIPSCSIWKPWTYLKSPNLSSCGIHVVGVDSDLKLTERISDIQVGQDHLLALTSQGRVFSGSTGISEGDKPIASKGQFGLASFSQFDGSPTPGKLFHIKLLKEFSPVSQIAAGDYHSLVRTKDGKLLVFGENIYGQLGIPYSYSTASVAVPTVLRIDKLFRSDEMPLSWKVENVAAGGSVSYLTLGNDKTSSIFAFGNGSVGHLGAGQFVHSQANPTRIHTLNNLNEYSETDAKVMAVNVKTWSPGATHTAVTLNSFSNKNFKDVMIWGGNEFYQLGTGKRTNKPFPIGIPVDSSAGTNSLLLQLLERAKLTFRDHNSKIRTSVVSQEIVAGKNNTAIYSRVG